MIQTHHTPGCEGAETDWFRVTDLNRRIDKSEFRYLHCQSCGLIRLDNVPNNLSDYYPDDYYDLPTIVQLASIASANPFKVDTIKRFVTEGKLLEIGPAYGVFAFQAKQAGFQVDVIEMDARCCEHLEQVVGVSATCSASPHEAISTLVSHDVIALWHVIEHLPNPWALISAAAENLAPNGILVMAAPNPDAWQFRIMGRVWPHLDAPRHLYLLPAQALTEYAKSLGLERVHYSTTDSDARSWNRFGWQRLLINRVRGKWLERVAFVVGAVLSIFMAPFESRDPKGSAYTLVFRKETK
jgi:2-polyprenyl-3-methyl-5-hydroxy-6-metoxy-1,4-benzoquinol methylase